MITPPSPEASVLTRSESGGRGAAVLVATLLVVFGVAMFLGVRWLLG